MKSPQALPVSRARSISRASRFVVPIIVALAAVPARAAAQTPAATLVDSARTEIDLAYVARDSARLARSVGRLDRALAAYPDDPYLLHYRGYARYRQVVLLFLSKNLGGAAPIIARAMSDLEKSGEKLAWPETFAVLASVSGLAIAIDPNRAMELGPQIGMLQGRAMQLGPLNPRVWLVAGIAAHNTPPEYGGGRDKAREMLKKAVMLFATDVPDRLAPAWGRDEAAAYLKSLDDVGEKRP